MAKTKITDFDETAGNNEDIGNISILGTAAPSNFDNAFRELMAQIAKVNAGTDPIADTFTLGDPADLTKRVRFDAGGVTAGQTRVLTVPDKSAILATRGSTSAKSATFSVTAADDGVTFIVDTTGGSLAATLPSAATVGDGFTVTIKKADGSVNSITVGTAGSETINGSSSYVLRSPADSVVTLVSDGTNWETTDAQNAGMHLLTTLSFSSGTARDVQNIPSKYRKLYLECDGLSFGGGSDFFTLALSSTNGSSFGSAAQISPTIAPGDNVSGWVEIGNIQYTTSNAKTLFTAMVKASDGGSPSALVRRCSTDTGAPADAVRITGNSGTGFNSGVARLWGVM